MSTKIVFLLHRLKSNFLNEFIEINKTKKPNVKKKSRISTSPCGNGYLTHCITRNNR